MRTLAKVVSVIVAISALTVMAPGHAETTVVKQVVTQAQDRLDAIVHTVSTPIVDLNRMVDPKDLDCLAKNIFYESANEPIEGKVAVGVVTLNRTIDDRFPNTVCGVVNQRTVITKPKLVTQVVERKVGFFGTKKTTETVTKLEKVTVCQFSWRCMFVRTPKATDERWEESVQIARELLSGGHEHYRNKYYSAIYFHAVYVKPTWASQKQRVNKVGAHIFYADRQL